VSSFFSFFERFRRFPAGLQLVLSYCLVVLVGFALLCLPWSQQRATGMLDNLFTAASALSTTGLTTVTVVDQYTLFGQVILLLLFQLGGLGYMSIISFFVLRTNRLSEKGKALFHLDFSLPEGYSILKFTRVGLVFCLVAEVVGALLLWPVFAEANVDRPLWYAIFHSVSALCTTGLTLFEHSFQRFSGHLAFNGIIAAISLCGAIGFIVVYDIYDQFRGRRERLCYTSRIILRVAAVILLVGSAFLFVADPQLAQLDLRERALGAFFQCMTAMTTVGFSTLPTTTIAPAPLFAIAVIMIIGTAPSGTGGGVKNTTVTTLFAQTWSTLVGRSKAAFLGRSISGDRVRLAASTFFLYIYLLVIGLLLLLWSESAPVIAILFEAVSAQGTVGLTLGLTPQLTAFGKGVVILLMVIGRIGPLSLGVALLRTRRAEWRETASEPEEDVAI
jgi:trk system potassium uptake protein TrkH